MKLDLNLLEAIYCLYLFHLVCIFVYFAAEIVAYLITGCTQTLLGLDSETHLVSSYLSDKKLSGHACPLTSY